MSADQGENTVLETVIPQDKTGGINRIFMGLSLSEIILIIGPTFLFFYTTTSILGIPLNQFVAIGTGAIALALYLVVKITPWYSTPLEVLSRTYSYVRERTRMPLVAEEAEEVPGVADVHPEHQAVEVVDGTLIGVVSVSPVNSSQWSDDQWLAQVGQLATSINSTIARDGGTGFDVKIRVSQTIPSAGEQVEGLKEAARNGYPTEDGGTPEYARKYAEEQVEATVDQLADRGIMDREIHLITSVKPHEANTSESIIDKFSNFSIVKASENQRSSQAALLDNRVNTVENAVQAFTVARRLDADELVQLFRSHWLDPDTDDRFEYSTMTTEGGVSNPAVDVDAATHEEHVGQSAEDESESEGEQADAESDESAPTPEAATDGGTATTEGESEPATDADAPDDDDSDEDQGRIASAREWVSSTVTSLRGHTSESTRDQLVYSPSYVEPGTQHVELNDQYTSTLWITGWPKHPETGLLEDILSVPEIRYDLSIYLGSTDYHSKLDSLASERQLITGAAVVKEEGGDADVEDATSLAADKQVLREQMQENDLECFEVGMAITIRAGSKSAMQDARRRIISRCSASNISTTTAHGRQLAGLRSTSPTIQDDLEEESRVDTRFDMTSDGVACLFPFGGYTPRETEGTTYGIAKTGQRNTGDPLGMMQVDRLRRTAPHRFWVGRSGSGKSFDMKNHIIEELLRNPDQNTVIVDIARGFDGPVEAFNGSKILVGETTINPFEIRQPEDARGTEESLDDKVRLITDMFQIYLMHNAPEEQAQAIRSTINMTVRQTFKQAGPEDDEEGITNDPETHSKQSPTMHDYFETLAKIEDEPEEYTFMETESEKDSLKRDIGVLLNRLKEFQPGGTYDYLCGESEVNLYDRVVYFDMNKFENDSTAAKGMMMALITSHAYELAKQTRGHVDLVVDEAHDLFRDAAQADQIESMVRAGRNTGLMFDFISQAGEDFDAGAAKVIAKQCAIAIWRDLGEMDVETPMEFGLSQEQAALVSGGLATGDNDAMEYSEALVDVEGDRYLIERRVSDYAARLVDYRESEHGEFDAYMEGISLEEQQAQESESVAQSVEDDESDVRDDGGLVEQPNVLGSGIAANGDESDADESTAPDQGGDDSSHESDESAAQSESSPYESDGADTDDTPDEDGASDDENAPESSEDDRETETDEESEGQEEAPIPDGSGEGGEYQSDETTETDDSSTEDD
ncbi:hypothetical protein [Halococcus sp. PRR34]|uniref:TraG/VirB4 family ATPase n=1 Tax=Halococcus sp. PRR34 TaxID=3020830 RepID=UPI00235F07D0|nr:hypothetical protein [Halococcus sp. PRR34]